MAKTSNIPAKQWAIYRNIIKANPEMSKKAAMTKARYAYQKRYATVED